MLAALAAGSAVIAAGGVGLTVVCWKHRAVLAGVLGSVVVALAAFAVASGPSGSVGEGALVIAVITLVVGFGLHGVGQIVERLLNGEQEGET